MSIEIELLDAVNRTYLGTPSVALGGPWLAVAQALGATAEPVAGIQLAFYGQTSGPPGKRASVPAYVVATERELVVLVTTGVSRDQPFLPETFNVTRAPLASVTGFAVRRGFIRDRVTIRWEADASAPHAERTIRDVSYRPDLSAFKALIENHRSLRTQR